MCDRRSAAQSIGLSDERIAFCADRCTRLEMSELVAVRLHVVPEQVVFQGARTFAASGRPDVVIELGKPFAEEPDKNLDTFIRHVTQAWCRERRRRVPDALPRSR